MALPPDGAMGVDVGEDDSDTVAGETVDGRKQARVDG